MDHEKDDEKVRVLDLVLVQGEEPPARSNGGKYEDEGIDKVSSGESMPKVGLVSGFQFCGVQVEKK